MRERPRCDAGATDRARDQTMFGSEPHAERQKYHLVPSLRPRLTLMRISRRGMANFSRQISPDRGKFHLKFHDFTRSAKARVGCPCKISASLWASRVLCPDLSCSRACAVPAWCRRVTRIFSVRVHPVRSHAVLQQTAGRLVRLMRATPVLSRCCSPRDPGSRHRRTTRPLKSRFLFLT